MDALQCGQLAGGYVHVSLPFQFLPHRGHPIKADLANDIPFYEKHLADDYTEGSSSGVFETKQELLADMRDPKNNRIHEESIHNIRVRSYGNMAIATYTIIFNETHHRQHRSAIPR